MNDKNGSAKVFCIHTRHVLTKNEIFYKILFRQFLDEIAEKILNMDPEVDSKFDPECDLEFNSDFGSGLGKR